MAFYTFQLERIVAQNIRSRITDVDLVSFAVFVNRRDQGHGSALTPVWPGMTLNAADITQGALINGYPFVASRMSQNWVIGPVEVLDTDEVAIVYTATNTSDSQIPTADQRMVNTWTIKLVDIYYSWLLGTFVSGLGLTELTEYVGDVGKVGGAIGAFLADPVGTALGVKPVGPCNGTVFADRKTFSGAALRQLPSTSSQQTQWHVTIPTMWSELTQHYTDEIDHSTKNCGDPAQTDVTIKVTHFDHWSLRFSESGTDLPAGVRRQFPAGGSLKALYGLRV